MIKKNLKDLLKDEKIDREVARCLKTVSQAIGGHYQYSDLGVVYCFAKDRYCPFKLVTELNWGNVCTARPYKIDRGDRKN